MILISSYEIAKEQQRDQRDEARQERASRAHVEDEAEAVRSGVRHAVAATLRRVANSVEPTT